MTTFKNQLVGSFDDNSAEYVEVWYDPEITGFYFPSVGSRDVLKNYHTVHGVIVEPRYVWAATTAWSNSPTKVIYRDGLSAYVCHVWIDVDREGPEGPKYKMEELRLGDKYGRAVARMTRTGYVQAERQSTASYAEYMASASVERMAPASAGSMESASAGPMAVPEGVTVVNLSDPAEMHAVISRAVGESQD